MLACDKVIQKPQKLPLLCKLPKFLEIKVVANFQNTTICYIPSLMATPNFWNLVPLVGQPQRSPWGAIWLTLTCPKIFNFLFPLSVVSHLHFFYSTHSFEITDILHSRLCHPNMPSAIPTYRSSPQRTHVLSAPTGQ